MHHRRIILCVFLMLGLSVSIVSGGSANEPSRSSFPLETGEKLKYDVRFLWLNKFARGKLSFRPGSEPGTFVATAYAKTRGIAKTVSNHLTQTYQVTMRLAEDGSLQPLSTVSTRVRGNDVKKKSISRFDFDYEKGEVLYRKYKKGKEKKRTVFPLPEDTPMYDLLSAFYNWRLGHFGELKRPSRFTLPTITKKGPSEIVIEIRSEKEQQHYDDFPDHGLLGRVIVDEEVFNTGAGALYVWVNGEGEPGLVKVEDVLGLGDVTAVLRD